MLPTLHINALHLTALFLFTPKDDTTGAPHKVARSHVAMYVNEVGHDETLVENVCPLETPRSVSYYVFIDKPMHKGEKRELLVNYGEGEANEQQFAISQCNTKNATSTVSPFLLQLCFYLGYEEMRVRRGYGKSNHQGEGSDAHDYSRVQRSLKDRELIEDSILSCSEEDAVNALEFFASKVWSGLIATQHGDEELHIIRRQNIARRRLNWLAAKFRVRLLQLCADDESEPAFDRRENSSSDFHAGMFVYVNGWIPEDGEMQNTSTVLPRYTSISFSSHILILSSDEDPRPPYTGIATIHSIAKHGNLQVLNVSIPGSQKMIYSVPGKFHFIVHPKRNECIDHNVSHISRKLEP
jgi:hypothetical protein